MTSQAEISRDHGLSTREAEVAILVSKGLSNKEVASQLFVTEKTVKFHLTNIYRKMSLKSRAQLIVKLIVDDAAPAETACGTATDPGESAPLKPSLPSGERQKISA